MADQIKKNIPGMIAAAGLALSSGSAMPKAPVQPATEHVARPWTPEGMDPEMAPIAHLESSWGKNLKHAAHPKGLFHTAFGAMGMKPVTAHEQYLRSPTIQKLFPGLTKPEAFTEHFQEDPVLYNLTASAHWQWLRKKLLTPARAAYGWRWGATAAQRAPADVIEDDPYVTKFTAMGATKLGKMAINDLTPGERKSQSTWDYSHLLTPENKMAGYQLMVSFHPGQGHPSLGGKPDKYRGEILHNGRTVGQVRAAVHTDCLGGPCIEPHSEMMDGHQKRGLGTAMYEAVFKEAKMGGIHTIHGHIQSPHAVALHEKLAQRHGLGYKANTVPGNPGGGEFKYLIKADPIPGLNISIQGRTSHSDDSHSDIRRLLSTNTLADWTMALRQPNATSLDLDHLLDRLSQEKNPELLATAPARKILSHLKSSPLWSESHSNRATQLPIFRGSAFTASHLDGVDINGSRLNAMLDDLDTWAPKVTYNEDGSLLRPGLEHFYRYRDVKLNISQFDKIVSLIHAEKLPYKDVAGNFFQDNRNTKIEPGFLNKWMDMGAANDDRALVSWTAKRANTSDALFHKVMTLPAHLKNVALISYADSGQMREDHFKHLLAHPASWTVPKDESVDDTEDGATVKEAIESHLASVKDLTPEMADLVVRHPNKMFRSTLATQGDLAPEVYRSLYKADPTLARSFVHFTRCPDDVRLDYAKKALDSGDEHAINTLSGGQTVNDREGVNEVWTGFSPEMVDLITNHQNPSLLDAAMDSPHLTTDQALNLVNRGQGKQLVAAVANAQNDRVEQPNLDKKAVINALAVRPQDWAARAEITARGTWMQHVTPEFYRSVAQNEMLNAHDPMLSTYGRDVVHSLLDPSVRSTPPEFLRAALAIPGLTEKAIYHPNTPQKDFDENFPKVIGGSLSAADQALLAGPRPTETTTNTVDWAMAHARQLSFAAKARDDFFRRASVNPERHHINERHLNYVRDQLIANRGKPNQDDNDFTRLYQSPGWSQESLGRMWKEGNFFNADGFDANMKNSLRGAFTSNKNAPESVLKDYLTRPHEPGMGVAPIELQRFRRNLVLGRDDNRLWSKSLLKDLVDHPNMDEDMKDQVKRELEAYQPDEKYRGSPYDANLDPNVMTDQILNGNYKGAGQLSDVENSIVQGVGDLQGHLQVRPGMQKLRKIRDLIMEKAPEKGEVMPKDLPPGDWSAGRLPNGNISAKKINEHIDSQEPHVYNYSHGQWNGAQRHTAYNGTDKGLPQKVFQVNLTNDMLDKLETAGVGHTFRSMVGLSHHSDHPVREHHTLGWVRYDGDKDNGFHIDEIQSDFGQSFVKQAAQQAAAQGSDPSEAAHRAESRFPEAHYGVIKNILFKDKHPNEMLAEAFHQYLRDQGHDKAPVHMFHAETKAPISGLRPERKLPANIQFTYDQLPSKKLGMEPKTYGAIAPQNAEKLRGKPTWGGLVRKFEQDLAEWAEERGFEELAKSVEQGDFKAMARAIDPNGGATVNHQAHLESHPVNMTDEVNDYRENVLESPTRNKRCSSKDLEGITRKVVYKTRAPDGKERKYMVKPYHEKVIRRVSDWMKHPIQGWAEMTHQALYHAAGMGDLHQKVHVSEHPMSFDTKKQYGISSAKPEARKEPALVVHLAEGFKPVMDHHFTENDKDLHEDTRKIGLMDFLSNNLDRHGLNLMVNPETRKVMAVDHSRSFQYKTPSKPFFNIRTGTMVRPQSEEDSLGNYICTGAVAKVIPPTNDLPARMRAAQSSDPMRVHFDYLKDWSDTIENWWPKVSGAVRKELDNHLQHIRNPKIVEHIRKNFTARANLLDEMAHMGVDNYGLQDWHETPVEIHKFQG